MTKKKKKLPLILSVTLRDNDADRKLYDEFTASRLSQGINGRAEMLRWMIRDVYNRMKPMRSKANEG